MSALNQERWERWAQQIIDGKWHTTMLRAFCEQAVEYRRQATRAPTPDLSELRRLPIHIFCGQGFVTKQRDEIETINEEMYIRVTELDAALERVGEPMSPPVPSGVWGLPEKWRAIAEWLKSKDTDNADLKAATMCHDANELESELQQEDGELAKLERELAFECATRWVKQMMLGREDGWLLHPKKKGFGYHPLLDLSLLYFELRGLIERHPDNHDLVRIKEPQETRHEYD